MYVVSLYGIEMNEFNAARMILNAAVYLSRILKNIFFLLLELSCNFQFLFSVRKKKSETMPLKFFVFKFASYNARKNASMMHKA